MHFSPNISTYHVSCPFLQPLSRSRDSPPFGAGLKNKADMDTTSEIVHDKENTVAAKPWNQPNRSKAEPESTVQPTEFKSNTKGAMLVFSPGKIEFASTCFNKCTHCSEAKYVNSSLMPELILTQCLNLCN